MISYNTYSEVLGLQNTLPNEFFNFAGWIAFGRVHSLFCRSYYLFRYHKGLTDKIKKEQSKLVALAFTIPIFFALLTDSLFPFTGIDFPGVGAILFSLTTFFVAYGMLKYELFSFRPEVAMESIFANMTDAVILVIA